MIPHENDTISFGRFKDKAYKDLPDWYLNWLHTELSHTAPNKRPLEHVHILKFIDAKRNSNNS